MTISTKTCRRCSNIKPDTLEWFYGTSGGKLDSTCKACRIAMTKARNEGNPVPPLFKPTVVTCVVCGHEFRVVPARVSTAKFCSYTCAGVWRSQNLIGTAHNNFNHDVVREKTCQGCGVMFRQRKNEPVVSFQSRKFCTKKCADEHGLRYFGSDNVRWKGERARKNARDAGQSRWSDKVLNRDSNTCQKCGAHGMNVELHAHHLKPFEHFAELRYDISNGVTLCAECHWTVHQTGDKKYLIVPDGLENVKAGVMRGRLTRRWFGKCHWCGVELSKRLSDVKGKEHTFCSKSCSMKHSRAFGKLKPTRPELIPETAVRPVKK